jgi:hypothetical protein
MRIYSNFVDYYDSVQMYGSDPNNVYIRTTQPVADGQQGLYRLSYGYFRYGWVDLYKFVISFCGSEFPVFVFSHHSTCVIVNNSNDLSVDKILSKVLQNPYLDYSKSSKDYLRNCLQWFFDHHSDLRIKETKTDLNIRYNCPVVLQTPNYIPTCFSEKYAPNKIILNPVLKHFDFFKIKDAATCYMELDMYTSGVLGNNSKEIVSISNNDKIEKHGFDLKQSFRHRK